jgi:hypothetical protein
MLITKKIRWPFLTSKKLAYLLKKLQEDGYVIKHDGLYIRDESGKRIYVEKDEKVPATIRSVLNSKFSLNIIRGEEKFILEYDSIASFPPLKISSYSEEEIENFVKRYIKEKV